MTRAKVLSEVATCEFKMAGCFSIYGHAYTFMTTLTICIKIVCAAFPKAKVGVVIY